MNRKANLFLWMTTMSFISSGTLGSLNLKVVNFAFSHELENVTLFSFAAVLTQMTIARVVFSFSDRLGSNKSLNVLVEIVAAVMLLVLANHVFEASFEKFLFFSRSDNFFLDQTITFIRLSMAQSLV